MNQDYIAAHLKVPDPQSVVRETVAVFKEQGFPLLSDLPLNECLTDEDALPDPDKSVGVVISTASSSGWVSVYTADWLDSGFLVKALSQRLSAWAVELWVVGSCHWGFTLLHNGEVLDRFADDPAKVAETEDEQALYAGKARLLSPLLSTTPEHAAEVLQSAHSQAGRLAAPSVDVFTSILGIPFGRAWFSYDAFIEDDIGEYEADLHGALAFRHLAFQLRRDRNSLAPEK